MPRNYVGTIKIRDPFALPKSAGGGRRPISKPLRDQVWLKYMGNKMQGKCYCCRIRMIHITDYQVGHNKSVIRGGKNHISNLRPICGPCNRGMGTKSIEWYRKKYFSKGSKKKPTKKHRTKRNPKKSLESLFPTNIIYSDSLNLFYLFTMCSQSPDSITSNYNQEYSP